MNALRLDPDLSAVPAQLRRLAAKCVVRDPKLRMRDIGDARMLLEEPQSMPYVGGTPEMSPTPS